MNSHRTRRMLLAGLIGGVIPFAGPARADNTPPTEKHICVPGASCAAEPPCTTAPPIGLHGTLLGSDGSHLNATIGITLKNSLGQPIDWRGCRFPHDSPAVLLNPNYDLPAGGSMTLGTGMWSVADLPGNAKSLQIETYPRSAASSPTGVKTTVQFYGRTQRHFALTTSIEGVSVTLTEPRVDHCPEPLGAGSSELVMGRIRNVQVTKSKPVRVTSFQLTRMRLTLADAFSALPDRNDPGTGSPIQGLSLGSPVHGYAQSLPAMASASGKGEPYSVVFKATGGGATIGGTALPHDAQGRQTFGVPACTERYGAIFALPPMLTITQRAQIEDTLTHDATMPGFYAKPEVTVTAHAKPGLSSADNLKLGALFLEQ